MHRPLEPLPTSQDRIVQAIAASPRAWHQPEDIATLLSRDPEAVTDDLAAMHVSGWLQIRERPDRILVTLSHLAADQLGVELVRNSRGRTRWLPQAEFVSPR
jgi:hypothetical protein